MELGKYGTDISYNGDDILPSLELQNTNVIVLEAICRRLQTSKGRLFYDLDYGYNLNNLIKSPILNMKSEERNIEIECLKDERVNKAVATINQSGEEITVSIYLTLSDSEEFNLVFSLKDDIEIAYERL